jgi:hypothetical protein
MLALVSMKLSLKGLARRVLQCGPAVSTSASALPAAVSAPLCCPVAGVGADVGSSLPCVRQGVALIVSSLLSFYLRCFGAFAFMAWCLNCIHEVLLDNGGGGLLRN